MSLLQRTAEALYLTWSHEWDNPVSYDALSDIERSAWEKLALTALTIAYREPISEDGLSTIS
jgi:hypothetical protein